MEIKKILACLEMSERDEGVLKSARFMAEIGGADEIVLGHVASLVTVPDEVAEKFSGLRLSEDLLAEQI